MFQGSKLKQTLPGWYVFILFFSFFSCKNETNNLTPEQAVGIRNRIGQMMDLLVKDISTDGPTAWLKYFEKTPDFFMASEGQLVFPNNDSATAFINTTLVKQISKIELQWSNIRIDPLTINFASIAATWYEDITDIANNNTAQGGYFTATAEKTVQGWQLRNAHWSTIKSK